MKLLAALRASAGAQRPSEPRRLSRPSRRSRMAKSSVELKKGLPLSEDAVREARGREVGLVADHGVYDIVARGAARGKLVRAKWLDVWGKNGMRSRLVVQDFNWAKRDDVTQNGRCAISRQQIVIVWTQGWSRGAVSGSMGPAVSPSTTRRLTRYIVVVPPKGVCPVGFVLQLRRAMDGTRKLGVR